MICPSAMLPLICLVTWQGTSVCTLSQMTVLCKHNIFFSCIAILSCLEICYGFLLQGFEMIKSLYLVPDQFTVENGLMTPTFKLKRPPLQQTFQSQIDAMYKKINSGR